ncbi:hypothetical protein EON83_00930 [bacterium]|nr:MAG: hypothetical protein EON83_00930 [bacterium]
MSTAIVRLVFASLCGIFFITIGGVAIWEWLRFNRNESALSPRHFRWRMLSAFTWLGVLGAFFISTAFLWPQSKAEVEQARRFLLVSSSALLLMLFAFALMAVDIFWTIQVGRQSANRRSRESQETLLREIERTTKNTGDSNGTS